MDFKSGVLPVLAALVVACGCSPGANEAPKAGGAAEGDTSASDALHALFADEWQVRLARDPLFASEMGIDRYNDSLPIHTAEDHARHLDEDRAFLKRLASIDKASLIEDDGLNYELFEFIVGSRATLAEHRPWLIPILSDGGFHIEAQRMYEAMPFETVSNYETYLARLRQIGPYFDQNIAHMREGLSLGITQPRAILEGIVPSITGPIVSDPEDSIYFTPLASVPGHFSEAERERLRNEAAEVIGTVVVPAYERFHAFFVEEYMPGARETLGASAMPGGEEMYADLVRYYTTLADAAPEDIHEIGLSEVARIRAEMEQIIQEVEFSGTFAEFIEFLRNEPRFYAETPEDLLKEAAWIAKRIDGQMPAFFGRIPRLPYGIMAVPADIAPNYTTGRYWSAPIGGRRGGYYLVNTHALDTRPLYELAALTAHEAAPGHHQQSAIRQEITGVPDFRRAFYPHAFGEGWGLYSEKLGIEFGIYDTPYDHFGRLSYEMWRACRLVIDTGIHLQGWTRDQAIAYLADNTALSLHNVRTEVDRYIAWPAQALAYKMGELQILELRRNAEAVLGPAFDLRKFHDLVLGSGGVTLSILERQVNDYIQSNDPGNSE